MKWQKIVGKLGIIVACLLMAHWDHQVLEGSCQTLLQREDTGYITS